MSVLQLLARGGATVSGVGQEDNLILRPPPFFALWIVFSKLHRSRRATPLLLCNLLTKNQRAPSRKNPWNETSMKN